MFDIGFWELALIGLVALVVVGPERLPRVARTVGLWFGKGRRILGNIKDEIDREIQADEMKQALEAKMKDSMGESVSETLDAVQEIKRDTEKVVNETKQQVEGSSSVHEAHDNK